MSLFRKLPYDPVKDFSPIVLLVTAPNVLIVHPSVPAMSLNDLIALAQMKANRARALAILSGQRSPLVPGVPTIAESGYPGFVYDTWYGVPAPARTPATIISRLNADIVRVLASPDVKTLLEQQGTQPAGGSPADFGAFIQSEIEKWSKAIKAAGVQPVDF